ncbi:MAG: DNA topoisomerase IV subunit B [Gammaproteobacteria bacterium]
MATTTKATKLSSSYNADDLEVLSGLDPVRRRPGMYTVTTRPNHLGQEVIDNSVDERLAGYASEITVILHPDDSLEVIDDGRGMPVDLHPEEKIPGVELILTRLHAGGKFSNKNYKFSGGLHGVGVSVVNALSTKLIVTIKRDGTIYQMQFANGEKASKLKKIGTTNTKRETGTAIHFWPDPQYFDSAKFSVTQLTHLLRAKAVLCPGLRINFVDVKKDHTETWYYEDGLPSYLLDAIGNHDMLPEAPFVGNFAAELEAADWAVAWLPNGGGNTVTESYVNLIPTIQGGTHVNGLRAGLLEAMREFCEFRNLLPRGVKLSPDDVWDNCHYVLSVKMQEPQFAGQTKERLNSRQSAVFVSGVVKDAFSLWLNQHVQQGEQLAELFINNAQARMRQGKQIARKKITTGPALPGKLADCKNTNLDCELFLVEGDSAGGSAKQARDREFQAIMPLRGKILNTWEVDSTQVLASQTVHDIAIAVGVDPGSENLEGLRYGKVCILADADSDGLHIATLLCALFVKHFPALVKAGHIYVAMPPLYRIDIGKNVYYALDDSEKQGILDRISAEKQKGKVNVQRFKGLGEMNPMQLRETTMAPETRRLVQLTIEENDVTEQVMDMLLAKKRASDRKAWLEQKGDMAEI